MITISIIDLIPNSFILIYKNSFIYTITHILIIFFIGVFISNIINRKIDNNNKLYSIGILSMVTIILHNIPEGIITYITSNNNIKLGTLLAISVAIHNIPEGISIGIPIYLSTKNKKKAFIYTLVSGLSEPFGALLTHIFLSKYINNNILGIIYVLIAGMMINISINLYLESKNYICKKSYKYFTLGCIIMIISHLLLSF